MSEWVFLIIIFLIIFGAVGLVLLGRYTTSAVSITVFIILSIIFIVALLIGNNSHWVFAPIVSLTFCVLFLGIMAWFIYIATHHHVIIRNHQADETKSNKELYERDIHLHRNVNIIAATLSALVALYFFIIMFDYGAYRNDFIATDKTGLRSFFKGRSGRSGYSRAVRYGYPSMVSSF